MNASWLLGLLLLTHQFYQTDSLIITSKGKQISVINRIDFSFPLPGLPLLDIKKYHHYLNHLDSYVYQVPINAKIDNHGNIISEKAGFRLHRRIFTNEFYSYYFEHSPTRVEIPLLLIHPRVDSELLGDIRTKRIGRYITSFNIENKTRTNNIRIATDAINNYVLFPGETFSFNKVVGKRTKGKGYLKAPVIIKGEYSEDIGGGICQVSSTLFNAVDNAGMEIIQRFSHSRMVPYIPPGRDATVSWYGPDFIFKNKYNQPIIIQAKTIGNKLVIKLFSSDVIEYTPRNIPSITS